MGSNNCVKLVRLRSQLTQKPLDPLPGDEAMEGIDFRSSLRNALLEGNQSPTVLAKQLDVAPATLSRWLRGESFPSSSSLGKILVSVQGNHFELLYAAAARRYDRIVEQSISLDPQPFDFQELAGRIIGEAATSSGLSEAEAARLFEIFGDADRHNAELIRRVGGDQSDQSELLILPEPSAIVANDWAQVIDTLRRDHTELYRMNWKRFEDLMAHLLEEHGWEITPMGYTKDDGVDLVAARRVAPDVEFTMMVQCKRYRRERTVGVSVVKDVWATKWEKGFHHAMIATTSLFTKGAKNKAEKWRLDLRDHDSIVELCKNYGKLVL